MDADPIARLVLELGRLPGIGERSAARLAYHIVRASQGKGAGQSLARDLAHALLEAAEHVGLCNQCQNLCTGSHCRMCEDPRRERALLCVVENSQDVRAVEASGAFSGLYHVLHGALCPLDGVGPDDLKIGELLQRLHGGRVREVILATNADVEGDATALYLASVIKPFGVEVSRLASGVPLGSELEYIDPATLSRALVERRAC